MTSLSHTADADEITEIIADAFIYAYPMLFNHKTLYNQALNPDFPGYVGGFGKFRNYDRTYTPADSDIVTANNDTPIPGRGWICAPNRGC